MSFRSSSRSSGSEGSGNVPPSRHRSAAAVTLRGANVCSDLHLHALGAPPKRTGKEGQGKKKKASLSRVRSTQKRHFTKEKPRGMKCVNHRLPLPGACTFARFAMERNFQKNATLAVHSHFSRRA